MLMYCYIHTVLQVVQFYTVVNNLKNLTFWTLVLRWSECQFTFQRRIKGLPNRPFFNIINYSVNLTTCKTVCIETLMLSCSILFMLYTLLLLEKILKKLFKLATFAACRCYL